MKKYLKLITSVILIILFLLYILMGRFSKTGHKKINIGTESSLINNKNINSEENFGEFNLKYNKTYDLFKSGNCKKAEEYLKNLLLQYPYNKIAFSNIYDLRVNCLKIRNKEIKKNLK